MSKKAAVEDSLDGCPAARITARDEDGDLVFENSYETAIEVVRNDNADKSTSSYSRMNAKMDIQQILLDRMELLRGSVQDLRKEMKDGFAAEAVKRQVDNNRLREQLSKSFDAEQCQIRKEMAMGFKKEEDARKQVQDYLEMVKEQIL